VCETRLEAHLMTLLKHGVAMPVDWKKVRQELNAERNKLFKYFANNPDEVRLAVEIKMLDNGMLRCAEHLQRERRDPTKVSPEKVPDNDRKP
jgi:hypothetical protein